MAKRRVIAVGVDGATFSVLNPLIGKDRLRVFQDFASEGTTATLMSTIPAESPQAWASIMTGVNQGKHGVFGFKQFLSKTEYKFSNNLTVRSKTLWKILSEQGYRSIVLNIPMTFPPEAINGILISGLDTPSVKSDFVYPPELKSDLQRYFHNFNQRIHLLGHLTSLRRQRNALRAIYELCDLREKLVLHLMKNYPWDFFCVNFDATDQIQHYFWQYRNDLSVDSEIRNAVDDIYIRANQFISNIMTNANSNTSVFIFSDHGFGHIGDVVFRANQWLIQNGFLRVKNHGKVISVPQKIKKKLYKMLQKLVSTRTKDFILQRLPSLRESIHSNIQRSNIDWEKTLVYPGENKPSFRINANHTDYDLVRENLIRKLKTELNPLTKKPLFNDIHKREDLYDGPYLHEAPDVIVGLGNDPCKFQLEMQDHSKNPDYLNVTKEIESHMWSGSHRLEGVFMARGTGIRKKMNIGKITVMDLMPTFLYSLGAEIPEGLDGRVVVEIFEDVFVSANIPKYVPYCLERNGNHQLPPNYTDAEQKEIEINLDSLGYL
jgi:predicted AlkP superfamily phosphohydrolase/phosphomutase